VIGDRVGFCWRCGLYIRTRASFCPNCSAPFDRPVHAGPILGRSSTYQTYFTRRVAIISSPRSGNTWLRRLLASVLGLWDTSAHTPDDIPWETLPSGCILQIHWLPDPSFMHLLGRYCFATVTLARHPLDLLISILHFSAHEPETSRWLNGMGGSEASIRGVTPQSAAFVEYAISARARALLSVSALWWQRPDCCTIYYEDLVHYTAPVLRKLIHTLTGEQRSVDNAIAQHTLEKLRATVRNWHFWQGRPGLWRSLLTPQDADQIARAHWDIFRILGYTCRPDRTLSAFEAEANWLDLDR
jgi:hypothetical protein